MNLYTRHIGDPRRPAILMLHGLFGDNTDWDFLIDFLKNNFYIIAVDLPGHGSSSIQTHTTFKEAIDNLHQELNLSKHQPSIIGYSMGGRIAMGLKCQYPGSYHHLIIESAHFGLVSEQEKLNRLENDLKLLNNYTELNTFFKYWYGQKIFGELSKHQKYPQVLIKRLNNNIENLKIAINNFSLGKQNFFAEQLNMFNQDICYIVGGNDQKYAAYGNGLANKFNHLQLKIISDASHMAHFEGPSIFAEIVNQFLSKNILDL